MNKYIESPKERDLRFDVIKILACILVVMNHIPGPFMNYQGVSIPWIFSTFVFFIIKTAVPLFMMVTGALVLKREKDYRYSFKKGLNFFVIYLVWDFFYWLLINLSNKNFANLYRIDLFLKNLIQGPVAKHLWYLPILIGFYLTLPFISRLTANFTKKDFLIFEGMWLLFASLIPFLSNELKIVDHINSDFQPHLFFGYVGFFILGLFLVKYPQKNKIGALLFTSGTLIQVIITVIRSYHQNQLYLGLDNRMYFPMILTAAGIFIFIFNMRKINKLFTSSIYKKIFLNFSKLSFGVYLIHLALLEGLLKLEFFRNLLSGSSARMYFSFILLTVMVVCGSFITSFVISKIPLLKKAINF